MADHREEIIGGKALLKVLLAGMTNRLFLSVSTLLICRSTTLLAVALFGARTVLILVSKALIQVQVPASTPGTRVYSTPRYSLSPIAATTVAPASASVPESKRPRYRSPRS
jgi:hypothetical protein